ncbi:MAG: hypothetical protein K2Y29_07050 [Beijerinckiaceae bacterium]|nr:hypothetical protein [Beijerinckiaceae bacterium]
MYLYEEAGTGSQKPGERVASASRPNAREQSPMTPQDRPSRPAAETFGSLPRELGANIRADMGAEQPATTAPLQPTPLNEKTDTTRDASLYARTSADQTSAVQDAAVEQRREAAIAQDPAAQGDPPPPQQAAQARVRPALSPELVAALRKRAAEAMARSDIIAARLLLERAAAGGDPQAVEDLARTYDPAVLEKMGLRGIFPGDAQQAARLYKEAQQARTQAQGEASSR